MSVTVETLKYTFSIANIKPRVITMKTPFVSNDEVETYNVELFSAMKFQCTQLMKKLEEQYPEHSHHIYAWRATSKLPEDTHDVGRIRFITTINKTKKSTHTNIELLSPTEEQLAAAQTEAKPKQKESKSKEIKSQEILYKDVMSRPVRRFVPQLTDSESEDHF